MTKGKKTGLLALFALAALLFSIQSGSVSIPLADMAGLFTGRTPAATRTILLDIRLPRVLASFFVGAGLSLSGAVMQSVLGNPLASSYTLGVSSGASLGAALVMVSGLSAGVLGFYALPTMGFVFGLATVLAAVGLSQWIDKGLQNQTVVLVGMVLSLFVNALLSLLSALSRSSLQQLVLWQMGSFAGKNWRHVAVLSVVTALCFFLLQRFHRELDILSFGDTAAQTVGLPVNRTKWILLTLASLATGTAVCFTGIIGFIDLIAPHMMRRVVGPEHRYLLPASALFGGGFMALCDTLARQLLYPMEIPVGALLALVGAPFFGVLYIRTRKGGPHATL